MNLLIMGLPGAGKGTQAAKIVEKFGVEHISTGDMFRAAIASQTEMGMLAKSYMDRGDLVPDEVTKGIVKESLEREDIKKKGFLLDGYPRTINQAETLDSILSELDIKIDAIINIVIAPSELLARLSGRIIHKQTGETFHKVFNPPVGNYNEEDYYQREDDKPEAVKRRLEVNIAQGEPIIAHYRVQGLVHDIKGDQAIDRVFADIEKVLTNLK